MGKKVFILLLTFLFSLFTGIAYATSTENQSQLNIKSMETQKTADIDAIPKLKEVLILNSYNKGLQWTDDVEMGIKDALQDQLGELDFTYEYMDLKKNVNPVYLHKMREFLKDKYSNKTFDAIIPVDDQAFRFITDYNSTLFQDIPVVFCGVNYFEKSIIADKKNITGVVESNDFKHTIDLALALQPNLKRMIVINDTTLTGENNRKSLDKVLPNYTDHVTFEFWSDVNMADIQKNVKTLGKDDIILLLSFNKDKSYNNFSHQKSIELIAQNAVVPIYGMLDFYMGHGLLGGMVTSGFVQGQTAGKMVSDILDGKRPCDIPVIEHDLGVYMFDYNMLKKYGIPLSALPKNSQVINRPFSLKQMYMNNRAIFLCISTLIIMVLVLFFILSLLLKNIKIKKIAAEKERLYALTDLLTGIPNRRACFNHLEQLVENQQDNNTFTIAFLDINRLKYVNDSYGHIEGDELIKNVCQLVQDNLNPSDTLYRMGGDEFLIIFNHVDFDKISLVWDSVECRIDHFNATQTKPYPISVSIGFIEYNAEKHPTIDELIDAADKKMYRHKMSYRKKSNL